MLGGAAGGRAAAPDGCVRRREGVVPQARDRLRRPGRARAPAGRGGVHAPAGDAAQGGHPAGRGAERAVASRPTTRSWRWSCRRSRQKVNEGSSLADTLAAHPTIFPDLYMNMVRSGEAAGNLDAVLMRLADFMDAQNALRAKVSGALTYPIIMMVLGAVVMGVLHGRGRPEDHLGVRGPRQGAALEHGAADLRLGRGRQLLVAADRRGRASPTSASGAGRAGRTGARSSIGSSCGCG